MGASYEDLEADPFIGDLVKKATRTVARVARGGLSPKFFQQLAAQAAKVAGGAVGGTTGANIATQVAGQVLRDGDDESWYESDASYEYGPIEPEVLDEMHYNAYQAAESESEYEADPFIANLVGSLASGLPSGEADPSYEELYEDGEFVTTTNATSSCQPSCRWRCRSSPRVSALSARCSARTTRRASSPAAYQRSSRSQPTRRKTSRQPTQRDVAAILGRQSARAFGNPQAVARNFRQNRNAASRAQARPASPRWTGGPRPGPMMPRPMVPSYGRAYGPTFGPAYEHRRGPVVGYMLKPIYADSLSEPLEA